MKRSFLTSDEFYLGFILAMLVFIKIFGASIRGN
jgi:hypothetical protein